MDKHCIRSWRWIDLPEAERHLIILGDSLGSCANCKELGINPWTTKECPRCHAVFQFITSRRLATHPHERFQLARRVLGERPELQMIDYDDYQKSTGSQKAREFFNP